MHVGGHSERLVACGVVQLGRLQGKAEDMVVYKVCIEVVTGVGEIRVCGGARALADGWPTSWLLQTMVGACVETDGAGKETRSFLVF